MEDLELWRMGGLVLGWDLALLMGLEFGGYWFRVHFPEYMQRISLLF